MLQRSGTFRYLLALLIAVWSPVCLCGPGLTGALVGAPVSGVADGGESGQHECCRSKRHKKSGCECPHLSAAMTKHEQVQKYSGGLSWCVIPTVRLETIRIAAGPVASESRSGAILKPAASLLRLHCALIV